MEFNSVKDLLDEGNVLLFTIHFLDDQLAGLYIRGNIVLSFLSENLLNAFSTDSSSSAKYSEVTLQGGEIIVNKVGPDASDYAVNNDDQVWLEFSITSGVNAEIRSWQVELHRASVDLDKTISGSPMMHPCNLGNLFNTSSGKYTRLSL